MEHPRLSFPEKRPPIRVPQAKQIISIGFRWRNRMILAFCLAAFAASLIGFLSWRDYQSEMKILVGRERLDPLVGPDQNAAPLARQEVTEEELNSELALLRGSDVLRKVVLETGLQKRASEPLWMRLLGRPAGVTEDEVRTAKALRVMDAHLDIKLPKKSNVIEISYRADDPWLAANVLTTYAKFYLEKHTAVHRPAGQSVFFEQHAAEYRQKLAKAERRLAEFTQRGGTVAAEVEKDVAVHKLGELTLTLQQTQAAIQETQDRISTLEQRAASTSPRMTTIVRTSDNPELMMQVKGKLLELELRRAALLQKFKPTYPAVQQVDEEIAKTRAAIAAAESAPLRDQTTDRDPTYEWMRSELVKARTDLESLKARASSIANSIRESDRRLRRLSKSSLKQEDLLRTAKALEAQYLLYLRKGEEARVSDAMDRSKILNVTIAQPPSIPVLPRSSPTLIALGGIVVAILISMGTAFVSEWADNTFRTPDEVQWYLELPVLAALPHAEKVQGSLEIRR